MTPELPASLPMRSPDLLAGRLEALRELLPEAFAEGELSVEKLLSALGRGEGPEPFGLNWPGKREALRLAQSPSGGTLLPAPDASVNWEEAEHVFLEGDNLEVLKLLQAGYSGAFQLIVIDPPYNTGNDFVYPDDFKDPLANYMALTGQADAEGRLTSRPETAGRFHSRWLSMMHPRLFLARRLLAPSGVIMVCIDDHEAAHLRLVLDELFGPENFVATLTWRKKVVRGRGARHVIPQTEYVLVYARDLEQLPPFSEPLTAEMRAAYTEADARGPYKLIPLAKSGTSHSPRPNLNYPITAPDGSAIPCPTHQWRWSRETLEANRDEVVFRQGRDGRWMVFTKQRLFVEGEERERTPSSYYDRATTTDGTEDMKALFGTVVLDFPKPVRMLKDFITWTTPVEGGALVLDFFGGSGTTAQAVLEQNAEDGGDRRFVLVQWPEPVEGPFSTIAEIAKERVRRVMAKLDAPQLGMRVYKLADSGFKRWDATGDLEARLQASIDPVLPDRGELDVVHELLLKAGLPLTCRVEKLAPGAYRADACAVALTPEGLAVALDSRPQTLFVGPSATADEARWLNALHQARRLGITVRMCP